MPRRKAIPARLRQQIAERDRHRCCYCRSPEVVGVPMVIDHIFPQAAGGATAIGRTTVEALRLNNDWLVRARRIWISAGLHPPLD